MESRLAYLNKLSKYINETNDTINNLINGISSWNKNSYLINAERINQVC